MASPTISITLSKAGKPKLTWKKIEGAISYKIYRSTSKNGNYSLMKTVKGTSYTNTSAKAGKTYYYKIIAVASSKAGNSAYSSVVFANCSSSDISNSKIVKSAWTEINTYRKNKGLKTLQWYTKAELAAKTRAAELKDCFSSDRPDGSSASDTIWIPYGITTEICIGGADSVSRFVDILMDYSKEECLSKDHTKIVIARNGRYWIAMFQ